MRRAAILIEAVIALSLVILLINSVDRIVGDFLFRKKNLLPELILKVDNTEDNKLNSDSEAVHVSQPYGQILGYAPSGNVVKLYVNDKHLKSIRVGKDASFSYSVPLRRGLNIVSAEIDHPSRRITYFPSNDPVKIIYRPLPEIETTLLAIRNESDGFPKAYGLAEPWSIIEYCYWTQLGIQRGLVKTDAIGAFNITVLDKNNIPFSIRLRLSEDKYRTDLSASETKMPNPWEVRDEADKAGTVPFCESGERFRVFKLKENTTQDESNVYLFNRIKRSLTINFVEKNKFRFEAIVELPKGSALGEFVAEGAIGPIEFVSLLFGLYIVSSQEDWDKGQTPTVNLEETVDQLKMSTRFQLTTNYFKLDTFSLQLPPFLLLAGDEFSIAVNEQTLSYSIPPKKVKDERFRYVWKGPLSGADQFSVTMPGYIEQDSLRPADYKKRDDVEVEQKSPIKTINQIRDKLPPSMTWFGYWLIGAIPYFWLMRILKRDKTDTLSEGDRRKFHSVVLWLLFIHLSYLSVWLLNLNFNEAIVFIRPVIPNESLSVWLIGSFKAFPGLLLGTAVVFSKRTPFFSMSEGRPRGWRAVRWWFYRCFFMWPAVLSGFTILYILPMLGHGNLVVSSDRLMLDRWSQVALILVTATFISWLLIHWFLRLIAKRPIPIRVSLFGTCAMLFLPLLPSLFDPFMNHIRMQVIGMNISPFLLPSSLRTPLWTILVITFGTLILWKLKGLLETLNDDILPLNVTRRGHRLIVLGLMILTAMPFNAFFNEVVNHWSLTSFFYNIFLLLPYVLLIVVYVLLKMIKPIDSFSLYDIEIAIGTMLFAFFLSGGKTNILLVPVPLLLGAYMFRRLINWPNGTPENTSGSESSSKSDLLKKLLAYKEAERLHQSFKKNAEKKYVSGELSRDQYEEGLETAAVRLSTSKSELKVDESNVQREIFSSGPGTGPFENAKIACKYSIPFVVLFQLGTLDRLFRSDIRAYPILEVVTPIVQSSGYWLLMAFLFGYFFHMMHGRSGPTKALSFSMSIALPMVVVFILNEQQILGLDAGERLLRVLLFVYYLALMAFDANTLRMHGYHMQELVSVYGAKPMLAYASSLTVLGALPLSQIIKVAKPLILQLLGIGAN